MIDYVLTAAVGISAGVGALVSARSVAATAHARDLPRHPAAAGAWSICAACAKPADMFMIPTYLFIACLVGMIVIGVAKGLLAGGHPVPVVAPPKLAGADARRWACG